VADQLCTVLLPALAEVVGGTTLRSVVMRKWLGVDFGDVVMTRRTTFTEHGEGWFGAKGGFLQKGTGTRYNFEADVHPESRWVEGLKASPIK
jgi:hypothetical protein